MKELGFEQIKSNLGIFLYKRKDFLVVVAIVYVDDAVFCGPSKVIIDEIKGHFCSLSDCALYAFLDALPYLDASALYGTLCMFIFT